MRFFAKCKIDRKLDNYLFLNHLSFLGKQFRSNVAIRSLEVFFPDLPLRASEQHFPSFQYIVRYMINWFFVNLSFKFTKTDCKHCFFLTCLSEHRTSIVPFLILTTQCNSFFFWPTVDRGTRFGHPLLWSNIKCFHMHFLLNQIQTELI